MKSLFIFLITVYFGLSFDRLNIFKYCILSSMLHEAGHITAYKLRTGKWPEIKVSLFGFTMKNNVSYGNNNIIIYAAGPIVNLLLCLFSMFLLYFGFKLKVYIFFIINAIIFILNTLPVYYLDGGQILYIKSVFYQNNYKVISVFTLIILCVTVISFTGSFVPLIIFVFYFIINLINDI